MDWIAALCLSVPVGAGIAIGASLVATATMEQGRQTRETVRAVFDRLADEIEAFTAAQIRVAKLRSGMIRSKVPEKRPEDMTPFETWLKDGGSQRSENIQNAVEWALGKVVGTEPDDEFGRGIEYAEGLLSQHAPGMAAFARQWQTKREDTD